MAPPLAAGPQTRAADIKMLNQRRWQEHVRAQRGQGTATGAVPPMMPMPTAGALFNRPNPVAYNHNDQNKEHSVNPYNRERDEFLPLRGERWAIRPDGSYKRTIEGKDEKLLDEFSWQIIVTHLEWARHDLSLVTERKIPGWVDGAIYGTVIISGALRYLPPGFYWGSELIYCVLSLSAKLYLGFFLLMNVILTDGTVEQALAPTQGGTE